MNDGSTGDDWQQRAVACQGCGTTFTVPVPAFGAVGAGSAFKIPTRCGSCADRVAHDLMTARTTRHAAALRGRTGI